jgi:competence protein ComEC
VNFTGFDFETWMFENRMQVTGSVKAAHPLPVADGHVLDDGFIASVDRLRYAIRKAIFDSLGEEEFASIMASLVVGDKRSIPREQWQVFSVTGVSHLMSISGMHVTMFAVIARLATLWVWRLFARSGSSVALRVPAPVAAAVTASLAAIGYAFLAGFNIPAQRTATMVTIASLASVVGLESRSWAILAVTLLAMLLMDPIAPLSVGFWLSFFAVGILFGLTGSSQGLKAAVKAQLAITLGIAPLTIALFQQLSVIGPLANALAIPVVTFLVTPLAMIGSIFAFFDLHFLLYIGHLVFAWLYDFLQFLAGLSWASLAWHAPPVWASVLSCISIFIVFTHPSARLRKLALLGVFAIFLPSDPRLQDGTFQATFLDVGQGTSVVIRTRNHSLVYDTGPSHGGSNAAQRVVIPQLFAQGIRRLDALVVSHRDDDHASGLHDLYASHRPTVVHTSYRAAGLNTQLCLLGQSWVWDGVWFRFLYPFAPSPETWTPGANEDSCVLEIIDRGGRRLLLTGDIPIAVEDEMVGRMPWLHENAPSRLSSAMVVMAPHHGSRGSTSEALLQALRPRAAIAQAGYRNRFGHPHADVLQRLNDENVDLLRTDWFGAIRLSWSVEGEPVFACARAERARLWHRPRPLGASAAQEQAMFARYCAVQPPSIFQAAPRTWLAWGEQR